jgi:hypothetical protein
MSKAERFAASVPREMFWSTDVGGTSTCPRCRSRLESERHTYVLATRERGDTAMFIAGNDAGHFCPNCATVVLDREAFAELASVAARARKCEFTVLGLVDLDAVPEEKSGIPLGDDDNPIPLVQFTNLHRPKPEAPGSRGRLPRWRPKRSRK